jgi:hypothetical protein
MTGVKPQGHLVGEGSRMSPNEVSAVRQLTFLPLFAHRDLWDQSVALHCPYGPV